MTMDGEKEKKDTPEANIPPKLDLKQESFPRPSPKRQRRASTWPPPP
jgi:hypothetical protein